MSFTALTLVLIAATPSWAATEPASAPSAVVYAKARGVKLELDLGGMIWSSWYLPSGQRGIEAARDSAMSFLAHGSSLSELNVDALVAGSPVVGPWTAAMRGGPDLLAFERPMLVACGALQALGMTLLTRRLLTPAEATDEPEGPTLSLSPIAAGHLGVSVQLTGF
jgi:hypothetical protein